MADDEVRYVSKTLNLNTYVVYNNKIDFILHISCLLYQNIF